MEEKFKCPWCDYEHNDVKNSMRIHASKRHGKSSTELKQVLGITRGPASLCLCGCGQETKPAKSGGYNGYIYGHHNRVKNNWGHNPEAQKKSLETRKREGRWNRVAWNKGLTKENSESLLSMSTKIAAKSEEYAERMRSNRLGGVVPTQYGPNSSQWKGGTSTINAMCHSHTHLFNFWKLPALKRAGYKCEKCGSERDLHVHHSDMRMAEIIRVCAPSHSNERESTHEEKLSWTESVVKWHVDNQPSSQVLCSICHNEIHKTLNF
jgi:hypothetical protein